LIGATLATEQRYRAHEVYRTGPVRLGPSGVMGPAVSDADLGLGDNATKECEACVDFMGPALSALSAIIGDGDFKGCPDLCSKAFPNNTVDRDICDGLCVGVGVAYFVELIKDGQSLWICEMLKACPYSDNDAGSVLSLKPKPKTGEQGTTFIFHILWELTYWLGVGELNVAVSGPGGAGTFSQVFYNFTTGNYSMDISLQTKPSQGDPWTPGSYNFLFQQCEGECGCSHPHGCRLVLQGSKNFTITAAPTTTASSHSALSSTSTGVHISSGDSSGDASYLSKRFDWRLGGHGVAPRRQ